MKAKPETAAIPTAGRITILTKGKANPRLKNTRAHRIFELYRTAPTVESFLSKGGGRGDLRWDVRRAHISITPAEPANGKRGGKR